MGRAERKAQIRRRKAQKRRNRILLIAILVLVVLAAIGMMTFGYLLFPSVNILETFEWEAGDELPTAQDFLKETDNRAELVTDLEELTLDVPGTYDIVIAIGKKTYSSSLKVVDTIAPQGTVTDLSESVNTEIEASAFVTEITDATAVTVSYTADPDFSAAGTQTVTLLLTDAGGNITELTAQLTLIADTQAPVITGVEDQVIEAGSTISYKTGVTVTDDTDTDVTLEIDNSEVDLNTPGNYTVTYTATDAAGNSTSVTAQITVVEAEEESEDLDELLAMAQTIIDSILTEDMDVYDELYEIFWYVKYHMTYTGSSDKSSWISEGIRAIEEGTGDCFTYYAYARALLTAAGYETITVERINGETQHFWCLVNIDGDWYHFDTCARSRASSWYCFLRTDAELEEFSELYDGYYTFDTSLYPATPEEPLTFDWTGTLE